MRVALLVVLAVFACKKADEQLPKLDKKDPPPAATVKTGTVAPDGVRSVAIEASREGYVPDKIPGKPGEKLKLVFTRRESGGECMAELKSPDGKLHQLPIDKPYEIAVTVPADGEVKFACGMEMFFGVIVAQKS
jgi:plastocyanin domain-containing protein